MEGCEMSKLIQDENEDDEITFYKGAFQSFDWNHSGRITTSVSLNLWQPKINGPYGPKVNNANIIDQYISIGELDIGIGFSDIGISQISAIIGILPISG